MSLIFAALPVKLVQKTFEVTGHDSLIVPVNSNIDSLSAIGCSTNTGIDPRAALHWLILLLLPWQPEATN